MKRTIVARRHNGPTILTAVPLGRGSVSIDNHEEPQLQVGQRVHIRDPHMHFDDTVTVTRIEPRQYGGYTYHFG